VLLLFVSSPLLTGRIARYGQERREEWEGIADRFMRAMRDGEQARAYAMFAAEAREETPPAQLREMSTGIQSALFDGYRRLEMTSWHLSKATEGTILTTAGNVKYANGYEGTFTFVYIREHGAWKVYSFDVRVPMEKIEALRQQ
jgi:hypothetical protein